MSRQGERIPRKLLVTGGSGYLGRWVVRLACNNWDVTATYLTDASHGLDVDWRRLDVRHQPSVEALITELRPEAIVHTAALNPGQGTEFHAVNAEGTRHVANAAAAVGARLIHVSTDVLFDGEKGNYSEEDHPSPITPYGRSKALAEEAVRASGANAVTVRTSLIYGPTANVPDAASPDTNWRQWDRQTRWIVGNLKSGKPVNLFTDERRCPIWVRSLASALVELADRTYTGILHVAGVQALSRHAFGLRLARFHGVDPEGITPALSRESGLVRPLDCTLDCSRARMLLHTPLPGIDTILGVHKSS